MKKQEESAVHIQQKETKWNYGGIPFRCKCDGTKGRLLSGMGFRRQIVWIKWALDFLGFNFIVEERANEFKEH